MLITLDITNNFNEIIDYIMATTKPIIYLNFLSQIPNVYQFELMNFGLNIDSLIESQLRKYSNCTDIVNSNFAFKSLLIKGKAKITISGVKGADIEICLDNDFHNGKKAYYSWDYKVCKGDFCFTSGGYLSFLDYFATINIVAGQECSAQISFSAEDYVFLDTDDKNITINAQAEYKYPKIKGKTFDNQYMFEYFGLKNGSLVSDFATKNEV